MVFESKTVRSRRGTRAKIWRWGFSPFKIVGEDEVNREGGRFLHLSDPASSTWVLIVRRSLIGRSERKELSKGGLRLKQFLGTVEKSIKIFLAGRDEPMILNFQGGDPGVDQARLLLP